MVSILLCHLENARCNHNWFILACSAFIAHMNHFSGYTYMIDLPTTKTSLCLLVIANMPSVRLCSVTEPPFRLRLQNRLTASLQWGNTPMRPAVCYGRRHVLLENVVLAIDGFKRESCLTATQTILG